MFVCVCLPVGVQREQGSVHVGRGGPGDSKKPEFRMLVFLRSLSILTSECSGSLLFCSQKMEKPQFLPSH